MITTLAPKSVWRHIISKRQERQQRELCIVFSLGFDLCRLVAVLSLETLQLLKEFAVGILVFAAIIFYQVCLNMPHSARILRTKTTLRKNLMGKNGPSYGGPHNRPSYGFKCFFNKRL